MIESAFSIVEMICRSVKRWRGGDHLERWVGSALLVAENKFRHVRGYQQIPQLSGTLTAQLSNKGVASVAGAAIFNGNPDNLTSCLVSGNVGEWAD